MFAFDHKKKKVYLFSVNLDDYQENKNNLSNENKIEYLKKIYFRNNTNCKTVKNSNFDWEPYQDKGSYKKSINKILDYINAGDIFQANFT